MQELNENVPQSLKSLYMQLNKFEQAIDVG